MADFDRVRLEMLNRVFKEFTLEDQRNYWKREVHQNRTAATQVNRIRAMFALFTGLASALAGLIVLITPVDCQSPRLLAALSATSVDVQVEATAEPLSDGATSGSQPQPQEATSLGCMLPDIVVPFLLLLAVIAPALGGAFGTLADLFQWDRLVNIYEVALENLEVADAKAPLQSMEDLDYRASIKAYAEGTLSVMRDETAQWGQIIRTPESLQKFIDRELAVVNRSAEALPDEVRQFIQAETDSIRTNAEETNRRLEELHKLLAQDQNAGEDDQPKPPDET